MGGRGSSGGGKSGGGGGVKQNFPSLTGSPKQISWAQSIRSQAVKDADSLLARVKAGNGRLTTDKVISIDKAQSIRDNVVSYYNKTSSASAIINTRGQYTHTAILHTMSKQAERKSMYQRYG